MSAEVMSRVFRTLVPATGSPASGELSLELDGVHWVATPWGPLPPEGGADFTCISYSWGSGRVVHPFASGETMSDRALPALRAASRALRPSAIWIDSLCIPIAGPEHTAGLRSMGTIYAAASQVAAVLSKGCAGLLEQIRAKDEVKAPTLLTLEADDWVTRAWTYQELVNSRSVRFLTDTGECAPVAGEDFLNGVGMAMETFRKTHGIDAFEMRRRHPRLDALEDLIADWMTASFQERSAYQVMSNMDRRTAQQPDDRFNAMLGAISAEPFDEADLDLHPAELLMRRCETKGDFSFIYSSAPRSETPGRRWRPLASPVPAIYAWHSFGDGQRGTLHATHLELENMSRMTPGLRASGADALSEILRQLRLAGFTGSEVPIELRDGYFFPQQPLRLTGACEVVAATGVRWVGGCPGLLVSPSQSGIAEFRGVGVFIGEVPKTGDSLRVG